MEGIEPIEKNMKRWYLFYNQPDRKLYQAGKELGNIKLHQLGGEFQTA